jgi:hypothetical protein
VLLPPGVRPDDLDEFDLELLAMARANDGSDPGHDDGVSSISIQRRMSSPVINDDASPSVKTKHVSTKQVSTKTTTQPPLASSAASRQEQRSRRRRKTGRRDRKEWTEEEVADLRSGVERYGTRWVDIR